MAAEDDLRLAWYAARDGRTGRRDALLTLAVAGGPPGAPWVERVRRFLVAHRRDHLFSRFATLGRALEDPQVAAALGRLRATFSPLRVEALLLREATIRGPWTGREAALGLLLDELVGPIAEPVSAGDEPRTVALPVGPEPVAEGLPAFYLAVLLAIAALLACVVEQPGQGARAA